MKKHTHLISKHSCLHNAFLCLNSGGIFFWNFSAIAESRSRRIVYLIFSLSPLLLPEIHWKQNWFYQMESMKTLSLSLGLSYIDCLAQWCQFITSTGIYQELKLSNSNNKVIKLKYYCFALTYLLSNLKPFVEFSLHSLDIKDRHFLFFCLTNLTHSALISVNCCFSNTIFTFCSWYVTSYQTHPIPYTHT